MSTRVVVLAGGTGGAKLARGMLDVVGAENLAVVANTGDDVEIYGAYVSPDPDLVTFWLADMIEARGWGIHGDTFHTMDGLEQLGVEVWFNLGDQDLAIGIERARLLAAGARLTEAQAEIARALGVAARVLPMSDTPVRTRVTARGHSWPFQEFMIRGAGEGPIDDVEFRGASAATVSPEVREALQDADAVVIGPSNPVISIGPILATPGMRAALEGTGAPIVAVSPLVRGEVVKGPTSAFMHWAGHPLSADGVAAAYAPLLHGLVSDERTEAVPVLETDVLMDSATSRRRLAEQTLGFALALR